MQNLDWIGITQPLTGADYFCLFAEAMGEFSRSAER